MLNFHIIFKVGFCLLMLVMSEVLGGKKMKSCKQDPSGPNCPSVTGAPEVTTPKLPLQASWDDWSSWVSQFPNCNPSVNSKLSPINIKTSSAIPVNDEQTLFVYSGAPIKNGFFYSAEYNSDGVFIAAVNLGVRKESFRDATFISGVGSPSNRYFQRAIFLFTTTPVESSRSLHQIDGKQFPLEIVMIFADIARSGQPPDDVTQIHIMVEISELITPNWSFLGAVPLRSQTDDTAIDSNEKTQQKQKVFEESKTALEKALAEEKTETEGDGYNTHYLDLDKLYKMVASADGLADRRKKETEQMAKVEELTKQADSIKEKKIKTQTKVDSLKEEVARDVAAGVMKVGDQNEKTDDVKRLQAEELSPLEKQWTETQEKLSIASKVVWDLTAELKQQQDLLDRYQIGTNDGQFKSVKDLKQKRNEMKKKAEEVTKLKEDMDNAMNSWEMEKSQAARDVGVETPFQPSWLLPAIGGYYRYDGSSVIPPCTPRTRVIVMEQSITISQAHFDLIAKYTNKGRTQDDLAKGIPVQNMDKNIPILRPLESRSIYFNKKNLQFKMDDGIHMKSKLRREIKDKMRKSGESSIKLQDSDSSILNLVALVVIFISVYI